MLRLLTRRLLLLWSADPPFACLVLIPKSAAWAPTALPVYRRRPVFPSWRVGPPGGIHGDRGTPPTVPFPSKKRSDHRTCVGHLAASRSSSYPALPRNRDPDAVQQKPALGDGSPAVREPDLGPREQVLAAIRFSGLVLSRETPPGQGLPCWRRARLKNATPGLKRDGEAGRDWRDRKGGRPAIRLG